MRFLLALALAALLAGCGSLPTLNSPPTQNHACSELKKPCSCPGMQQCGTGRNGQQCCTPDDCSCNNVTAK